MGRWRRLFLPHIQAGAGDFFLRQGLGEGVFVVDEAPCGGNEIGFCPHQAECSGIHHLAGVFCQRAVDADKIGLAQQRVEIHLLAAARFDLFCGQQRIERQHTHVEQPAAEFRDAGADIANTQHADGAILQFAPGESAPGNFLAGAQIAIGFDDAFRQRQHHRQRVLRHAFLVAAGLVDHNDAGRRAGIHVDRVVAGAVGGRRDEVGHFGQQRRCHMEMRRDRLPRRPDLEDVRHVQDGIGLVRQAFVLQPVELHVRPLRQDLGVER